MGSQLEGAQQSSKRARRRASRSLIRRGAASSTHPLGVLQEPLVCLLPAKLLEELVPVSQYRVHVGLVLDCQLQRPARGKTK